MVRTSILRRSYPDAPVSSLFLFGKQQDLAFQIEVNGNPHARHHVRFWRAPSHWRLPGGRQVDWVGAATYDRRVGFSLLTGQFTHKIAGNTDEERNFVGKSIAQTTKAAKIEMLEHFMTAYRARNGGGDSITTDGGLLLIDLR